MNPTGSATSATVPPRRLPLWLVILAVLAVAKILGGSLTVVLNPPQATFGAFANTPLNGETHSGTTLVNPQALAGWAGVTAGIVVLVFCVGWFVGRHSAAHR
ncbi:MAG: hypothetical protein MOP51_38 [Citricoccus sp.]|nr:hypothetical protein [Citricoccus sp. WCRC_4]